MADASHLLEGFVRSGPAASFVDQALEASTAPSANSFRAQFASVPRRLGANAKEQPVAPSELAPFGRPHFTWTDWVRALLVGRALLGITEPEQPNALLRLFEGGEIGEQESLLRTLSLLKSPARYVQTGLLGCRTNARRVFEAIACENPFPPSHFPDTGFNQMVMKAIFIEVPVGSSRVDLQACKLEYSIVSPK